MAGIDLSLEFLMGRALDNAMLNVGMKETARGKCSEFMTCMVAN
jgi:glucan phosphorylase